MCVKRKEEEEERKITRYRELSKLNWRRRRNLYSEAHLGECQARREKEKGCDPFPLSLPVLNIQNTHLHRGFNIHHDPTDILPFSWSFFHAQPVDISRLGNPQDSSVFSSSRRRLQIVLSVQIQFKLKSDSFLLSLLS